MKTPENPRWLTMKITPDRNDPSLVPHRSAMKIEQPRDTPTTTQACSSPSSNSPNDPTQSPSASAEHFQYPSAFDDRFGFPSLPSLDYSFHASGLDGWAFTPYSTAASGQPTGALLGHQVPANPVYAAWQRSLISGLWGVDSMQINNYHTFQGSTGSKCPLSMLKNSRGRRPQME